MYPSYTPLLCTDENMEGIQYNGVLPFDNDDFLDSNKVEQTKEEKEAEDIEAMEEVIDAADPYQIVIAELDMGKDSIRSLVTMARTANETEKHEVSEVSEFDDTSKIQASDRQEDSFTLLQDGSNSSLQQAIKKKRGRPRKHPKKEVQNSRGKYRKYDDKFIIMVIDLIQNVTLNCAEAARIVRMPERTAQDYFRRFRDGEEYLPSQRNKNVKGPKPMLMQEHTRVLQEFYDDNATATIKEAQEMLWNKFKIAITQSGLHKHLVTKCGLTMKKLEKISQARNSEKTFTARMQWVLNIEKENIDFESCVFIDEAGFNFHMQRTFGRSKCGTPAKAVVSNNRGVNVTILGAIAREGLVNLSLRSPQAVVGSKKRKLDGGEERIVSKIGTRTQHFLDFLDLVMDALDKNNLYGKTLVMDNARIHHGNLVREAAKGRGYDILYLPLYSPFLNPIELFWSKLKSGVRRELLTKDDTLTPRIIESAKHITGKDCQGWILHSKSFFPRCLLEEEKL